MAVGALSFPSRTRAAWTRRATFCQQRYPGQHLLVQDAHEATRFFVSLAHLCAELLEVGFCRKGRDRLTELLTKLLVELQTHGRKFSANLGAELHNLQLKRRHVGGEIGQFCHFSFQNLGRPDRGSAPDPGSVARGGPRPRAAPSQARCARLDQGWASHSLRLGGLRSLYPRARRRYHRRAGYASERKRGVPTTGQTGPDTAIRPIIHLPT